MESARLPEELNADQQLEHGFEPVRSREPSRLMRSMRLDSADRVTLSASRPLIPPSPRSAMFFPLVVLVAVLPGLVALTAWDLTPPGPWWGLRGLAILDGEIFDQVPDSSSIAPNNEAAAYRAIAYQPPLYAWLESIGFWLSAEHDPLAGVLPSYIAGGAVVVLSYLHGRLWRGGGLGLTAALLVGFNHELLLRLQVASPSTLALAGTLAALLCYGWHVRAIAESAGPWPWAGPKFWAIAGGLSLGVSLLSMAWFGLIVIPIVILHQVYLWAGLPRATGSAVVPGGAIGSRWSWLRNLWRERQSLAHASLALGIAAAVALPWHLMMFRLHGWEAFASLAASTAEGQFGSRLESGLLSRLLDLAPASVPLAVFGGIRSIRQALIDENNSHEAVGGAFWLFWLAVAVIAPGVWPTAPKMTLDLFLLVPLSLLAAQSVADLINRKVPVRSLAILAPATAASVAWWLSLNLREAFDDLLHGRADAATALGVHLAVDLVLILTLLTRKINLWARRRDDRQRFILAVFLITILVITVTAGMREVWFRHEETGDLLLLRTAILRRNRERPFNLLAVVGPEWVSAPPRLDRDRTDHGQGGPESARGTRRPTGGPLAPGGRLRFVLRTALPQLRQRDLAGVEELLTLQDSDAPVPRLIILSGSGLRLSYPVQSRLGLEAIHPGRSDMLEAYATPRSRPPKR